MKIYPPPTFLHVNINKNAITYYILGIQCEICIFCCLYYMYYNI